LYIFNFLYFPEVPSLSIKYNLFDILREGYPSFSKQQKAIADFILAKGLEASYMTTLEIAEETASSAATVVRFTQSLGYASFSDFTRDLQTMMLKGFTPMTKLRESMDSNSGESGSLSLTCRYETENLFHLLEMKQNEAFEEASELMAKAGRIYLTGARSAFSLVYYGGFLLRELVHNVFYFPSGSESVYEDLEDISSKDVLISVCFHRYARNTVKLTSFASRKGAKIIALTDGTNSPLRPFSDVVLSAPNNAPFYSYVPAMAILDGLIWAFAKKKKVEIADKVEQRLHMLLDNEVFI